MAQQNKDTNELIKVRRQKLTDLQEAGKNPFEITKYGFWVLCAIAVIVTAVTIILLNKKGLLGGKNVSRK